ncbi:hypothetical protein ASF58_11040 [Methylobacterium sp. Leaf125]|uniref:hypothetical protein n=1 Tax=Methylobacterium sp. Leaf125 TaxID=1736265 RepID=UPI0006FC8C8F|nr:hypothetical protein [Methylobacterium sp. Leaf125]KQQ32067.1 hypothetical protein ASF58_11040 [Methylobacterium sp. Leaf125]
MRRETSEFRTRFTDDGAKAIAVNDAEIVIAKAILASVGERFGRPAEERAHEITQALDAAGFDIRYRTLDILPDEAAARYGKDPAEVLRQAEAMRQRAEELGLTRPAGSAARVGEARLTGDWSKVSDADWTAWVNVLRQSDPAAAAEFLPTYETLARPGYLFVQADGTVALRGRPDIEVSVNGVVERTLEPATVTLEPGRIEELPAGTKVSAPASETGYAEALRLVREGRAWPGAITRALGGASADGPEGNVWKLYSERMRTMGSDAEPEGGEPEKDNWGVCCRLANDMAARHGCRVELTGRDDPADPNSYHDDLCTFAVVTDRSTGRLVGLVECWDTEDGDPIVPRTWLKAVLLAWRAQGTPKRAA